MNLDGSADPTNLTMSDMFVQAEGGILPAAQALFVDQDSDADGIPDAEDDSDGDGVSDADDADDDGDGRPDADDDDDDVVFVGRQGYTGIMSNNPVRTFWAQETAD
jgi:hypothetical protein